MSPEEVKKKLAAILSADVEGRRDVSRDGDGLLVDEDKRGSGKALSGDLIQLVKKGEINEHLAKDS
jgi:hypothetical protein